MCFIKGLFCFFVCYCCFFKEIYKFFSFFVFNGLFGVIYIMKIVLCDFFVNNYSEFCIFEVNWFLLNGIINEKRKSFLNSGLEVFVYCILDVKN